MRDTLLWGLAAGFLVLMLAGCAAASDEYDSVPVYSVADTTRDWGFPSPYAHYSRGPGYVRMKCNMIRYFQKTKHSKLLSKS